MEYFDFGTRLRQKAICRIAKKREKIFQLEKNKEWQNKNRKTKMAKPGVLSRSYKV